jgi:inorganic pyrophosphatase
MTKTQYHIWRPHPWHGLEVGPEPPRIVNAYIEITPFDLVKYEVDKVSGYLHVDRPQRASSQPPVLYGFIPRTLCGEKFRALSPKSKRGDGDPQDICVISERPISKSDIILQVKVIGGIQMIDHEEADDKLIGVLASDYAWGNIEEVGQLPPILVERLQHYFRTYKLVGAEAPRISLEGVYGQEHALRVVEASMEDYLDAFPGMPPAPR